MARILYGVNGEGMGHATRSDAVIHYLLEQGHTIDIVTSSRAYDFLSAKYDNVHRVKGFDLVYSKNSLSNVRSMLHLMKTMPKDFLPSIHRVAALQLEREPNVVISDFEFFSTFCAKAAGIPVISANNISIVDRTKIDVRKLNLLYPKLFAVTTAKLAAFYADHYVIPTFFFPTPKKKNVHLTNPVTRDAIAKAKPTVKDHILVYQTSPTCLSLLRTLKGLNERFEIYGYGAQPTEGNLHFHPFSEKEFIQKLASAKAVIVGGGFSLISEALYLKKPVLSVPLHQHFEQIVNAFYIEKLGYGEFHMDPSSEDVARFLNNLETYRARLSTYSFKPSEFAATINGLVERVGRLPNLKKLARFEKIMRPAKS